MGEKPWKQAFIGVPEREEGNIEYKSQLTTTDPKRLEQLASQMKYRLHEGGGQAIYVLGLHDDGSPANLPIPTLKKSEDVLQRIAQSIGAGVRKLREYHDDEGNVIAEYVIEMRKKAKEIPKDTRIVSLGNVDAGKSTLIGSLKLLEKDDGRGKTRLAIFRHRHELETGRTSAVAKAVIGFDANGNLLPQRHGQETNTFIEQCEKTITFSDLAGHEKYLKTTIFGLSAKEPDYAMLIIAANQGVLPMTKEHLGLALALDLPMFIVITKIDIAPEKILKETLQNIKTILRRPSIARIPYEVKEKDDVFVIWRNMNSKQVTPIFTVSSVTWQGMDDFILFLSLLSPLQRQDMLKHTTINEEPEEFEYYIDEIFQVKGTGTVVNGIITQGEVSLNDHVLIGPMDNGKFIDTRVKGIEYNRVPLENAWVGMSVTLALHNIKRSMIRKGMVIRSKQVPVAKRFEAVIHVLYHSTTIKPGYSPVIHLRSIRQVARITSLDKAVARTGDKVNAGFEFLYRAERIKEGDEFVFREGHTRGIGKITKVIYND